MSRTLRVRSLGLALAAVLASAWPSAAGAGAGGADALPGTLCKGLFVVEIAYGDDPGRTLAMILDTGASRTYVDPDAAARLLGREVREGRRVTLRGGRSGPLELRRMRVRTAQLDHLARALGRPVDGILGVDVFEDLVLTLDYAAGEARVARGRLPREDGKTIFADVSGRRPFLEVDVAGRPVRVLVDSGFTGALDLRPGEIGAWREEPRGVSAAVRFSSVEIVKAGRADATVRVGPLVLRDPIVRESSGTRLLGAELMRHATWTFDLARDRIRIEPVDARDIDVPAMRGTGLALRPVERGLEVLRVFAGSAAADAGLETGDLIVTWRGMPIHERGCAPFVPEDGGEAVPLGVERDGRLLSIELRAGVLVP